MYDVRMRQEARTHELFDRYLQSEKSVKTYGVMMVAIIFRAFWIRSLRIDQLKAIGDSINEVVLDIKDYESAVDVLVNAGVLRPRQGMFEVNYD